MKKILFACMLVLLVAACSPKAEEKPREPTAQPAPLAQPAPMPAVPAAADACEGYLSLAEINDACGTSLAFKEKGKGEGTGSLCDRKYASGSKVFSFGLSMPGTVDIRKQTWSIQLQTKQRTMDALKYDKNAKPLFEKIPGLGDDAYKADFGNGKMEVAFLKGAYTSYVIADTGLCTWDGLIGLDKKIAGRLA